MNWPSSKYVNMNTFIDSRHYVCHSPIIDQDVDQVRSNNSSWHWRFINKATEIFSTIYSTWYDQSINLIICTSKTTTLWNVARVCPICKSWETNDNLNCKPICILYVKPLLKHVHIHMYAYLQVPNHVITYKHPNHVTTCKYVNHLTTYYLQPWVPFHVQWVKAYVEIHLRLNWNAVWSSLLSLLIS